MKAGNFKDAYLLFRELAVDPKCDPKHVSADLKGGVHCLQRLGRVEELDEFREAIIAVHKDNWRLLETAALSYNNTEHYGYIVAGKLNRGNHRGGGKFVSSQARDRVRALQLMQQALPLTAKDADKASVAQFHLQFANLLLDGGGYHEPWRLQYLTDLTQLPDYDETGTVYYGRRGYNYGDQTQGAPVDAEGKPIFHHLPKSYEAAKTDGERWRWMLHRVTELAPARTAEVRMIFANFLREQF